MKKESIFKKIFSSKKDCCSVNIEEVEEKKDKVPLKESVGEKGSTYGTSKLKK